MCICHTRLKVGFGKYTPLINMLLGLRWEPQRLISIFPSIVCSPRILLPQCTSFTAEHRDGASQGGRWRRLVVVRRGEGQDEEGVKCLCIFGDKMGRKNPGEIYSVQWMKVYLAVRERRETVRDREKAKQKRWNKRGNKIDRVAGRESARQRWWSLEKYLQTAKIQREGKRRKKKVGEVRKDTREGAGLQIKSAASSHPVSPTRLPSSSSLHTSSSPHPSRPSLLVHLHGNQTGCLIHELNIFPVAGWAGY